MSRAAAALATAALVAGCAHTAHKPPPGIGSASYRSTDNTGLAHYQLALGQVAVGATLQAHAPPVYPPALLAACAPLVELPARVIVGPDGHVSEVRMDQPAARLAFAEAVRQAVKGWLYSPLTITRWAANADGTTHPLDSEIRPFSLDYVFTFRCEHGHTSVSSGASPASH